MNFLDSDINKIILNTLIDYKEIDIVGVATLKCKLTSSSIDSQSGLITAPQYVVEVHRSGYGEAISIENIIADSYQLPLGEAKKIFSEWKENISTSTASTAPTVTMAIDGVGNIVIDSCNSLSFHPAAALMAELNPLQQNVEASAIVATTTTAATSSHSNNTDEQTFIMVEENTEEHIDDDSNRSNDTLTYWKQLAYLFMALFAISVGVAVWIYLTKPKLEVREIVIDKGAEVSNNSGDDTINGDSVFTKQPATNVADGKNSADKDTKGTTTNSATKATKDSKASRVGENTANTPYHVVFGAFKERSRAEKTHKKLTDKNYNSLVLKRRALNIVTIGSFSSKIEAQQFALEAEKRGDIDITDPLWIYYVRD